MLLETRLSKSGCWNAEWHLNLWFAGDRVKWIEPEQSEHWGCVLSLTRFLRHKRKENLYNLVFSIKWTQGVFKNLHCIPIVWLVFFFHTIWINLEILISWAPSSVDGWSWGYGTNRGTCLILSHDGTGSGKWNVTVCSFIKNLFACHCFPVHLRSSCETGQWCIVLL